MMFLMGLGFYTIWLTPIVFIGNLVGLLKAIKNEEETKAYTVLCAISLWLIVVPMFVAILQSS